MNCPLCEQRKPRRFCPARGENICSICCGTEREVTIDCPADCIHLIESRRHETRRPLREPAEIPFGEVHVPSSFVDAHGQLILALSYAVCAYARDRRELADVETIAALQSLAESYRTRANGIYYEKPPGAALERGLYDALKEAIEEFKKSEERRAGFSGLRDSEIRDGLILLTQIGARRTNGRPRGRAYLGLLRSQFKREEFARSARSAIVIP